MELTRVNKNEKAAEVSQGGFAANMPKNTPVYPSLVQERWAQLLDRDARLRAVKVNGASLTSDIM